MLSHSFSTNQSGTTHGFWSPVPSGRHGPGTEFSVPEVRGGGYAEHPPVVTLNSFFKN